MMAQVCWTGAARAGARWEEGDCTAGSGGRKRAPQVWGTVCLKAGSIS